MRGAVRRSCTAGLIIAALVTGLGACTGDSGGSTVEKAGGCTGGTYAWSEVRRAQKLTGLADPITFEKETDSYAAKLRPVGDTVYRPSVTGAPRGVGAGAVIKALGKHLKVEEPLAGPSEAERPVEDHYFEVATGDLKGSYYSWSYISLVEADFTYTCGSGEPVKGHVRTWDGTGSAFLPCWETTDDTAGRIAARETCPAGSAAAKAA